MAKQKKKEIQDVSPADAISALKAEILDNARKLAENKIMTIYPLVEAANEKAFGSRRP
jgi:hypothetical protein